MISHRNQCFRCQVSLPEQIGPDCPRCGYPLDAVREEQYLRTSLYHFQQELRYRGGRLPIAQLQHLYDERLRQLFWNREAAARQDALAHITSATAIIPGAAIERSNVPQPLRSTTTPISRANSPVSVDASNHVATPPPQAQSALSLRSFFSDQAINIVATLGAFLILIGSLSFIVTTQDLQLAFLVLLGVHALFGVTGALSFCVQRLRIVSVIYTAIFALQVPLVGYAALRLVDNNVAHPPIAILIMLASLYATVAYGALAVYQRFKPFGYLAGFSLLIAVVSIPFVLLLPYYWSCCVFLLCALPLLLCVRPRDVLPSREQVRWEPLREPGLILHWVLLAIGLLFFMIVLVPSLLAAPFAIAVSYDAGVCFSIVVMLALLIGWVVLYARRALSYGWLNTLPYLVTCFVCALVYLCRLPFTAYILALTCCVVVAYILRWRATRMLRRVPGLSGQMVVLALIISVSLPFIIDPALLWQLIERTYAPNVFRAEVLHGLLAVNVGVLLLCGLLLLRECWWGSLEREHMQERAVYRWWCLLAAFIVSYAYGILLVQSGIAPVWEVSGLALACVLLTIVLYRASAGWHLQSATWTLVVALASLGLAWSLPSEYLIALLLFYAVCSYVLACYLGIPAGLIVAVAFALAAIPALLLHITLFFILTLCLPLGSLGYVLWLQRTGQTTTDRLLLPPVVVGVFYSVVLLGFLCAHSTGFFFTQVPVLAWEMVALAAAWFLLGLVAHSRTVIWLAFLFALPILYCSLFLFWALVLSAGLTLLLGWVLNRWLGLQWGTPFAVLSVCAMGLLGLHGLAYSKVGPFPTALPLVLIVYALVLYGLSLQARLRAGLVLMVVFMLAGAVSLTHSVSCPAPGVAYPLPVSVACSTYSTQIIYWLVGLITGCVLCGLVSLRVIRHGKQQDMLPWGYACYVCAAGVGIVTLIQVFTAPTFNAQLAVALLLFLTLLTCIVMLVERQPELLALAVALAVWAILCAPVSYEWHVLFASLVFVLTFAQRYLWRRLYGYNRSFDPDMLSSLLALLGQCIVLVVVLIHDGLFLMHAIPAAALQLRVVTLAVLSGLLLWLAYLQKAPSAERSLDRWYCLYMALFIFSWIPTVECYAWQITDPSVLCICPALCLLVLSWLIVRHEQWVSAYRWSQTCALLGASLLLGPTFFLSFTQQAVQSSLIPGGEALALLACSFVLRQRILLLCGIATVIVAAIHLLFLPALGIPSFLALSLTGILLLGIATLLLLIRPRLTALWGDMD